MSDGKYKKDLVFLITVLYKKLTLKSDGFLWRLVFVLVKFIALSLALPTYYILRSLMLRPLINVGLAGAILVI